MKIFVENFDKDTDENDLEALFGRYGPVENVTIWRNWRTGKSEGRGIVEMLGHCAAKRAIEGLDGRLWNRRRLKVRKTTGQYSWK